MHTIEPINPKPLHEIKLERVEYRVVESNNVYVHETVKRARELALGE